LLPSFLPSLLPCFLPSVIPSSRQGHGPRQSGCAVQECKGWPHQCSCEGMFQPGTDMHCAHVTLSLYLPSSLSLFLSFSLTLSLSLSISLPLSLVLSLYLSPFLSLSLSLSLSLCVCVCVCVCVCINSHKESRIVFLTHVQEFI
jgi:hypothetical protein